MIQDDSSQSESIRPGLAVRVDPVRLLYLPTDNSVIKYQNIEGELGSPLQNRLP